MNEDETDKAVRKLQRVGIAMMLMPIFLSVLTFATADSEFNVQTGYALIVMFSVGAALFIFAD